MKLFSTITALAALAALGVPAAASAHTSVYTDDAQLVNDPGDPGTLTPQTRYVVANHGFTYVLRESNADFDGDHRGVYDYKSLPGAYRATLTTWDQLRNAGATDAQAHATCRVLQLETEAAIKSWQGTDPFYAYVPFQKDAAGLEDDPATWIPKVKALTNVDLDTLADAAAAEAACEALPGASAASYVPADATQSTNAAFNSGLIEHTTAPLAAEITGLKGAVTAADQAKLAVQAALDLAKAEIAKLAAAAAPMKVALPSASAKGKSLARNGAKVTVTGPAGAPVTVELKLSERAARKLKLKSPVLASAKATIGAGGAVDIALKPRKSARKALKQLKGTVALTVTALSVDRFAATTGTVSR